MHFSGIIFLAVLSVAVGSFIPDHEVHHHAQPYAFGYSVKDHHGEQHREESGDGGNSVKGSYGFTDDRGVHRQVNYVADHGGFRAEVKTNEPGTANQDPAAVKMISSAHDGHGYGIASGFLGVPVGHHGYAPVAAHAYAPVAAHAYAPVAAHAYAPAAVVGNHYSAPLHGGHVSMYDSRFGHVL